jgi:hypothetical protein
VETVWQLTELQVLCIRQRYKIFLHESILHIIEMSSSHKRNRADRDSEDSDEEYAFITPRSSSHNISTQDLNSETQEVLTNGRPRRATAKYNTATQRKAETIPRAPVKKRRYMTAPDNKTKATDLQQQHNGPRRSTSLQILPSETSRRPRDQSSAALAELARRPDLLVPRSNELHVEDPAQSSSTSMSNLTWRFSMPFWDTSLVDIPNKVAGQLINHWRTWANGPNTGNSTTIQEESASNGIRQQAMEPNTIKEKEEDATTPYLIIGRSQRSEPMATKMVASDAPARGDEQLSFSYVKPGASDYSDESFEEIHEEEDQSPHTRFESPANDPELGTDIDEQPPPPQHGHPAARRPYKPYNVLPQNAIRREDSALVWDSHDRQDSSRIAFDNMSDPNFISYEKATRLGFSPLELPRNEYKLYSTLSGHEDLATQYIELDIEVKSLGIPREKCFMLVVDSSEIEIILGYYYLSQHEVFQRLVGESSSRPKAFAIFSKKPTQGMGLWICWQVRRSQLTMIPRANRDYPKTKRRPRKEG